MSCLFSEHETEHTRKRLSSHPNHCGVFFKQLFICIEEECVETPDRRVELKVVDGKFVSDRYQVAITEEEKTGKCVEHGIHVHVHRDPLPEGPAPFCSSRSLYWSVNVEVTGRLECFVSAGRRFIVSGDAGRRFIVSGDAVFTEIEINKKDFTDALLSQIPAMHERGIGEPEVLVKRLVDKYFPEETPEEIEEVYTEEVEPEELVLV